MNLRRLRRGFDEILPEGEFDDRLRDSCRIKLGVDPTASELHLGHAVVFNKLRQFQDLGHTVVFVIGDFTARIGDPSGRDETRPSLPAEEVEGYAETYTRQAFEVLDEPRTEVVRNSDWFDRLGTEEVLDLASRTTVARMLERDDFSNRFENNQSIRLHEFLYPLLQGYDSVEVEADMELGGTDQKFNLLVGRQLQKELSDQSPQLIGTLPLLVGTDGTRKMSKSYDNHIPLRSSGRDLFGRLMSVPDSLVESYATLLTDLPRDFFRELKDKIREHQPVDPGKEEDSSDNFKGVNLKEEKKRVAYAVVKRLKGKGEADDAREYFERTVEDGELPMEEDIPTFVVNEQDVWIVDLLEESGMVESRGEAKRLLQQGGVYLDGKQLEGFDYDVSMDDPVTIRVGKHRYRRAVPSE